MRLYYIAIGVAIVTLLFVFMGHASAEGTPFSVSGQVIDSNGNPVSGAIVTLIDSNFNVLGTKTTGADGTYNFLNVVSDFGTVKVEVNFTKDGVTYTVPSYYTNWVNAEGIEIIPSSQTQIPDYPPPVYGYVWGAIETPDNQFIDGVVYIVNIDNGNTYYEFANNTDGKASFSFYVPAGNYWLYAQHYQYGAIYESAHQQITVTPNSNPTGPGVSPYQITLSLGSPTSNPDPAVIESPHINVVSGNVSYSNGYPAENIAVALYEMSDNGTGLVKMNYTATTDNNGHYEFSGVVPTSDGNVVIQANKSIQVEAQYIDANGTLQSIWSTPEILYYPDVILGYSNEDAARNIEIPTITLPVGAATLQASSTAAPSVSLSGSNSGVATGPFIAAVAVGLLCITGVYFILNRKN
jgi:5-hydroxyisourate hydrolase-like protein (transthyretin family)